MVLDPGGLLMWVLVGLVAGWLAGRVMRGGGFGLIGDIVLGIIGAFVGSFVANLAGFQGQQGVLGSILVAFAGAVIVIAVARSFSGRRRAF
jgi:uncharacterized membrane protein YeaQ/YmgE (transglycosylase-associated protein family)